MLFLCHFFAFQTVTLTQSIAYDTNVTCSPRCSYPPVSLQLFKSINILLHFHTMYIKRTCL